MCFFLEKGRPHVIETSTVRGYTNHESISQLLCKTEIQGFIFTQDRYQSGEGVATTIGSQGANSQWLGSQLTVIFLILSKCRQGSDHTFHLALRVFS